MRNEFAYVYALGIALAVVIAGCSEEKKRFGEGGEGGEGGDGSTSLGAQGSVGSGAQGSASGAGGGGGQGVGAGGAPVLMEPVPYPDPPYGYAKGSTIENHKFYGLVNPANDSATKQTVALSDFYNPTGTDVYPPGSPYGEGAPKPTTLLIHVGAMWASPSQNETTKELPPRHTSYHPCGGEFMLVLHDGPTPGKPATLANLTSYTTNYAVNYPSVVDPAAKLTPIFSADAYPQNILIDTRTMTIVDVVAGVPAASFWTKFEQVLDNAACVP